MKNSKYQNLRYKIYAPPKIMYEVEPFLEKEALKNEKKAYDFKLKKNKFPNSIFSRKY